MIVNRFVHLKKYYAQTNINLGGREILLLARREIKCYNMLSGISQLVLDLEDCICLCQKIKGLMIAVICYFLLRTGKGVICRMGHI